MSQVRVLKCASNGLNVRPRCNVHCPLALAEFNRYSVIITILHFAAGIHELNCGLVALGNGDVVLGANIPKGGNIELGAVIQLKPLPKVLSGLTTYQWQAVSGTLTEHLVQSLSHWGTWTKESAAKTKLKRARSTGFYQFFTIVSRVGLGLGCLGFKPLEWPLGRLALALAARAGL